MVIVWGCSYLTGVHSCVVVFLSFAGRCADSSQDADTPEFSPHSFLWGRGQDAFACCRILISPVVCFAEFSFIGLSKISRLSNMQLISRGRAWGWPLLQGVLMVYTLVCTSSWWINESGRVGWMLAELRGIDSRYWQLRFWWIELTFFSPNTNTWALGIGWYWVPIMSSVKLSRAILRIHSAQYCCHAPTYLHCAALFIWKQYGISNLTDP